MPKNLSPASRLSRGRVVTPAPRGARVGAAQGPVALHGQQASDDALLARAPIVLPNVVANGDNPQTMPRDARGNLTGETLPSIAGFDSGILIGGEHVGSTVRTARKGTVALGEADVRASLPNPNDLPHDINGNPIRPDLPLGMQDGARLLRRGVVEELPNASYTRDANGNLIIPVSQGARVISVGEDRPGAVKPGTRLSAGETRVLENETAPQKKARLASDKSAAANLKVANAKAAKQAKADAAAAKKAEKDA